MRAKRVGCALALFLSLGGMAACGGGGGSAQTSPVLLSCGNVITLYYTGAAAPGALAITIRSSGPPYEFGYVLTDPVGGDDEGSGTALTWSVAGSTSTLVTPYCSSLGYGCGTNTWTMTWTSGTAGTATDLHGATADFTYAAGAGCGAAEFSGPYFVGAFEWSDTDMGGRATWGTWTADGVSNYSDTWTENDVGALAGPFLDPTNAYTVGSDGALDVSLAPPSISYTGGFGAGGQVAVFAQTMAGTRPYLGAALRQAGAHGDLDLYGTHHVVGCLYNTVTGFTSVWGKAGYDGSGTITSSEFVSANSDGTISTGLGPITGTYGVALDGTVTATTNLLGTPWQGGVLGAGALLHMIGSTNGGTAIASFLSFPVGSGLTDGTLEGTYWIAGIQHVLGTPDLTEVFSGTATADGAGTLDIYATLNVEGTIVPYSGPFGYAVASDGTVSAAGGDLAGAVSPDGQFAFLAGGTSGGSEPLVYWLVRR